MYHWTPRNTTHTSEEDITLAETLFNPETHKVFCELEHFTHPSIGIVVSR